MYIICIYIYMYMYIYIYMILCAICVWFTSMIGTISSSAVPNPTGLKRFTIWEWHFHTRRCELVQGDAIRDHQATIILLSWPTHGLHPQGGGHSRHQHPNWIIIKVVIWKTMRMSWVPHPVAIGFWWSLSKELARLHVWVHRDLTIITPEFLFHAPWIHPKFRHPLDTEEMCRVSNA